MGGAGLIALAAVAIELLRYGDVDLPHPLLGLGVGVIAIASIDGLRSGLWAVALWGLYGLYGVYRWSSPEIGLEQPLPAGMAIAAVVIIAGLQGWSRDRQRQLAQTVDQLQTRLDAQPSEREAGNPSPPDPATNPIAFAHKNLQVEQLLGRIVTDLMNFAPNQLDAAIGRSLGQLAQATGFDRSYIVLLSEDGQYGHIEYEWYADSLDPLPPEWRTLPTAPLPWWMGKLQRLEGIEIPCLAALPAEASYERLAMQAMNSKSILAVPLVDRGQPVGYIGFSAVQQEKQWSGEVVTLLRLVGAVFLGAMRRQRAEEALKHSESLYQRLLEQAADGIFLADADGKYCIVNSMACAMTGYTHDELLQMTITDLIAPADLTQRPLRLDNLQNDKPLLIERQICRKDGSVMPVEVSAKLLEGNWVQAIVRDISDRQQAATQLRFQVQLLDNVQESVVATDLEGNVLYWGKGAEALYGYPADQVLGQPITFILPAGNEAVEQQRLQHVLQEGWWRGQYLQRRRNGPLFWADTLISLMRDDQGQACGFIGIDRDVTASKQAEQNLRNSEERFRSAIVDAPFPIMIYADKGEIVQLNQVWTELTGYRQADLPTLQHWLQQAIEPQQSQNLDSIAPFFRLESPLRTAKLTVLTTMGDRRIWSFKVTPLAPSSDGRHLVIAMAVDITEQTQAEADLQHLNQTLESQVAQRTTQLEAMNRELDSFAYSVSHDLRAPLRHINGFVTILRQELVRQGAIANDKTAHYLKVIESSSQTMVALIEGLLLLSRTGRQPMRLQSVDLKQLVDRAIALVKAEFATATEVQFTIYPLPSMQADATLLQQVFTNLIHNAVKFSSQRSTAQIEIGVLPNQTIFIRDNGVGFPMDHADQLFGAFQRLHSQQEFAGTGIGLAIVERIIRRHDGQIWAESQLDQGTCFYFKLNCQTV